MNICVQNFESKNKYLGFKKQNSLKNTVHFGQNLISNPKSDNSLVDKNHNRMLVKNISFKGNALPMPRNSRLEKAISSVMTQFGNDDIILIGKNLNEAKEQLQKSVSSIPNLIKKVFFIKDEGINGALAIGRNELGGKYLLNLNSKSINIETPIKKTAIKHNGISAITNIHDVITDNFTFMVKENNDSVTTANSKEIRDKFVQIFNLAGNSSSDIKNLNSRNIDNFLMTEQEKASGVVFKKTTFADIGGQDEAIEKIKKSVVYPIKYPTAFKNQKLNRGIILEGPPGTGKTLLAQSVANEVNAHFIQLNGLELESKWVGESEQNWRDLFAEAKENSPTVIFIDEFDAIGKQRSGSEHGRFDDKVVNQLLTLMSDVEKGKFGNIFLIVATNRADVLDEAIVRSGRFGTTIKMERPKTVKDCMKIFDIQSKDKPMPPNIDKESFAKQLLKAKATGADISHIVNEAHQNAYERLGVFEKMENNTFKDSDLNGFVIEYQDLKKAFSEKFNKIDEERIMGFAPKTKKTKALSA